MCGIFGFAKKSDGQTNQQLETLREVFTNLASDSVVRGTDSTGISIINPASRSTFKSIVASDKVVKHETWKSNILDRIDSNSTIGIGHVRLATHGEITKRNAHPFEIGDVLGAHNGVIYNYNTLAKKYNKNLQVDSEVIFAYLNNMRDVDALEQLDGDFALSWVKDSNEIVHLARESSRPISVAYWKKAKILLWASTNAILEGAMNKAGLALKNRSLEVNKIYSFDTSNFGSRDSVTYETFKPIDRVSDIYSNWKYADTTYYGSTIYSNQSAAEVIVEEVKCDTCSVYYEESNLINLGDDIDICYDCYEDVESCEWCGDYSFAQDLSKVDNYSVCEPCKPSLSKQLLLPEACGIVRA